MGKKSKILYYSTLLVNIVCFILDLLPIPFPFFRISFSISLMLIGLWLMVRAFSLKLDSSLFLGVALLGCGILNFLLYFGQTYWGLSVSQIWPYYIFAFAIASFVTSLYFKEKFQMRIFFLLMGLGLIALAYVQQLISLWLMITLMIVWFVGYFIINSIRFKRGK